MDSKVVEYINKQKSPQKEICLVLRGVLLKTYPKINEEMKWGAIVYDNGRYYIGVVKYGVNMGFAVNGLSDEEQRLFNGHGKSMRSLKFQSLDEIDEHKLMALIKLVHDKAVCTSCGTRKN